MENEKMFKSVIHLEHEIMRVCPKCKGKNVRFVMQELCYVDRKPMDMITYRCEDCGTYYKDKFNLPKEYWDSLEKWGKE